MMLIDTRPEYPPEWDDADAKEEWVNDRKNALLEEECDPYDPINLAEFIGNLDPKVDDEKALLIKLRVLMSKHEEFKPILEASCDYWTEVAEQLAEKEFDSGEFFDED